MIKSQAGFSFSGFIMACFGLIFAVILLLKVLPVYIEYYSIQSIFSSIVKEEELKGGPESKVLEIFRKRASINNIENMPNENIVVVFDEDGFEISSQYERRVPLFANMKLIFDFNPIARTK